MGGSTVDAHTPMLSDDEVPKFKTLIPIGCDKFCRRTTCCIRNHQTLFLLRLKGVVYETSPSPSLTDKTPPQMPIIYKLNKFFICTVVYNRMCILLLKSLQIRSTYMYHSK